MVVQNINKICNKRGVPLKINTYTSVIEFNIFTLDILPSAIMHPNGIDKIKVIINISIVTFNPSKTCGIKLLFRLLIPNKTPRLKLI